jgi:hypothetical protein
VFLPVVEADIKRFGGVGEFLKGRACAPPSGTSFQERPRGTAAA